ncbi:MAG: hypothetical protein ACREI3_09905 [Nitrospirales bacterium]
MWLARLHAVLGSLVITFGLWMMWGDVPLALVVAVSLGAVAFLVWKGRSLPAIWAWATFFLGVESLSWPVATMVQARMATGAEPTDEQMGHILTAVLFGTPSAIFWLSFSYGIFQWIQRRAAEQAGVTKPASRSVKKKARRSR